MTARCAFQALGQDKVYLISREVVQYAFPRAAAGRIEVEIHYDQDQLRERIRDDSKGIDPKILEDGRRPFPSPQGHSFRSHEMGFSAVPKTRERFEFLFHPSRFESGFFLIGVAACHAQLPQAHISPVPLKLPVDAGTEIRFAYLSTAQGLSQVRDTKIVQDDLRTGNGLAKFDRERNILTYYSFHAGDTSSTVYSGVAAMLEDRHGNLWLATQGSGLLKLDREHNRFISYTYRPGDADGLAEDHITTLFEDRDGSIWVALPVRSLQRFSPVPAIFQPLHLKQNEDGAGCFYEDSHRNLWFGTSPELYRVDPSGKRTAFVGVKPGVPFDVLSVVEDRAGFIWAGTSNNGLFRLDPKNGHWKSLSHKQTPFSLTFAALAYSNSPTNRYRYMLEGLDNSWTEVGSDSRTVTYNALPAEKYRFRVQGATNSSIWSEPGAELEIIVLPAWWNTWWFRTVYALAALLIIWFAYRYRVRQIAEQLNIRIDAQVNERTRIARELHDPLLQSFQGAVFQFQAARRLLIRNADNAMEVVDEAIQAAEDGITEGRAAIQDLRPEPAAQRDLPELLKATGHELADAPQRNGNAPTFNVIVEGKQRDLSPYFRMKFTGSAAR